MGKKAFFKNTISLAKGAVGALCLGLLFAACDFGFNDDSFQNKAAAYFKEMTSTAAISSFEIAPEDSPTDKNGSVCLDYENDGTVVFTLRNPQHYTFTSGTNMTLELAGSPADSPLPLADQVTIAQDPDDATKITVTYPSEFLKANPAGANISPIVTLFHPVSMASFGSYSEVKLASNAKPPVAAGAIAMQTQETPSKWVICFNLPAIGMVKAAHPDLTTVSVNGSEFAATVTQGKVTFPSGSNLKTEDNKPSNLAENQITHLDFEANGQPCYFMTDDVADETERFYTIVITDDAGLSSELEVSTKGLRLSTPNGYAADDTAHQHPYSTDGSQNYSNESDDGSGEMRLYAKAVTDGEAVPYDPSDASIIYEVYTDEACADLVTFGKIKGTDGVIPVPGGDSYIKAYARKPLYADSKVVKWMSRVVRAAIYIAPASEGGSDSNDGSKAKPYLTIQKAVDAFKDAVANDDYGDGDVSADLEVRVKGNLTAQPAISVDLGTRYKGTLKIVGWEGARSVASASSSSPALYVQPGQKAELKDIKLSGKATVTGVDANGDSLLMTGCEISGFKTGLVVDAGNATLKDSKVTGSAALGVRANAGIISLDGCEISKNGLNPGTLTEVGGVWIESSVSVAIKGGKISGNKAKASGAGIRSRGALALDGVEISGNEVTDTDGFAGGIDVESGSISITGKNQIFGNKAAGAASDLCLPVGIKINVTGSLAGSTIGVSAAFTTSPTIDTPVAFTTNYRVKNAAIKPGKIFKGQPCSDGATYGIAANSAGEASFAIGGGGADYGADEYEFGFELADSQDEDVTAVYLEKAATVRLKMAPTRAHIGETPVHELYYKGSDKELYADSAFTEPALDIEYSGDRKLYVTASLWLGGSKRATLSPAWNSTGGRFDVTIPAQTAEGDYTVKVEATYLGLAHAVEFPVNISKRAENAAFYIRNLSAAGTYPVAVEGGVGSGYELDGSGIPVPSALVDNGLARVADAIRLHGQSEADLDGVYISLDARGTTNSSDIESYAAGQYFMDCAALSAIYLPDWMEYVVPNLFENCIRLETVELSPNTQWIGNDGFKGCSKLASISLPQDVTGTSSAHHLHGIEAGAFVGCKSGFKITYAGTKEQWGNVVRPDQATSPWHVGPQELDETGGSVTCSDGSKPGLDWAPSRPVSSLTAAPTEGTYTLSTLAELKQIQTWVTNVPRSTLEGVTFKLTDDIDTQGEQVVIGYYKYGMGGVQPSTKNYPFKGTFDGDGHKITNTINVTSADDDKSALFYCVEGGTIKNLTVAGTSNCNSLVGVMIDGTVENCVSETNITVTSTETWTTNSSTYIAGIVAYVRNEGSAPVIKNCVNKGNITVDSGKSVHVGGVVGELYNTGAEIDRCINKGNISVVGVATNQIYGVGGIAGAPSTYKFIRNCKNIGAITTFDDKVGGIAGNLNNGGNASATSKMILNCCNLGTVNATADYGSGVFGKIPGAPNLKNNCSSGSSYWGFGAAIPNTGTYPFSGGDWIENNYCLGVNDSSNFSQRGLDLLNNSPVNITYPDKLYVLEDAGEIVGKLNDWITNSGSSSDYATWEVKDGKPELVLGELDNK